MKPMRIGLCALVVILASFGSYYFVLNQKSIADERRVILMTCAEHIEGWIEKNGQISVETASRILTQVATRVHEQNSFDVYVGDFRNPRVNRFGQFVFVGRPRAQRIVFYDEVHRDAEQSYPELDYIAWIPSAERESKFGPDTDSLELVFKR